MIHSYMNAVGFFKVDDINALIKNVVEDHDIVSETRFNYIKYKEYHKNFTDSTGIAVLGYYKDNIESFENFVLETYFPYVVGSANSMLEATDISIERFADKYSYLGMFDSTVMNMVLIFFINDLGFMGIIGFLSKINLPKCNIKMSALALEGIIVLPIMKEKKLEEEKKVYNDRKSVLIERAKRGDEDAIETLTIDDLEIQQMLYTRSQNEDVLSIVDTYFMPEGLENDKYGIMGDIISVKEEKNFVTEEEIYVLDIFTNDVNVTVSINKKNLTGEPLIGRRFRGKVWLQSRIVLK